MPELPEVEFARRCLERWFEGRQVVGAEAPPSRIFRGAQPRQFGRLRGSLCRAERKGKYLLLSFERDQGVLMHLGMSGKLVRRPRTEEVPYSRARLLLDDDQTLHLRDPRLFGRVEPVPARRLWSLPVIAALGVDPLNQRLTPKVLAGRIGPSRQPLKVALMDQRRVAGLGNIHAAEALYRARLHPSRAPGTLTSGEWRKLTRAIYSTFELGLRTQEGEEIAYVEEPGTDNPFLVYGRAGERCRRCGTTFASFLQAGRTTHFCPGCQAPAAFGEGRNL